MPGPMRPLNAVLGPVSPGPLATMVAVRIMPTKVLNKTRLTIALMIARKARSIVDLPIALMSSQAFHQIGAP